MSSSVNSNSTHSNKGRPSTGVAGVFFFLYGNDVSQEPIAEKLRQVCEKQEYRYFLSRTDQKHSMAQVGDDEQW